MEKTTLYRRICIRGLKLLPSHIILSQYCDTLLELNVFCVATKESKQKCTRNKLKLIANEICRSLVTWFLLFIQNHQKLFSLNQINHFKNQCRQNYFALYFGNDFSAKFRWPLEIAEWGQFLHKDGRKYLQNFCLDIKLQPLSRRTGTRYRS